MGKKLNKSNAGLSNVANVPTDSVCVIGDVHGCIETLKALIKKLPHLNLCFVGDLIDRGPDSSGVVRLVREQGWKCVQGNHELMSYDFQYRHDWCHPNNGGTETLASYPDKKVWDADLDWIKGLPFFLEYPEIKNADGRSLIVTHSGIYDEAVIHYPDQLVWNRMKPIDLKTKYSVFGHTPVKEPNIEKHFALIDTAAVYGASNRPDKIPGVGLTAFQFPEMKVFFQETLD